MNGYTIIYIDQQIEELTHVMDNYPDFGPIIKRFIMVLQLIRRDIV